MRKIIGVIIPAVMLMVTGCPSFETPREITDIGIFIGNDERYSVSIEEGETITLTADVGSNPENAFIVWELDTANAAIIGSGMGTGCSIRGMSAGTASLTIRAWRNAGDEPAVRHVSVTVTEPQIKDIILIGPLVIGIGEERSLVTETVPAWADDIQIEWSGGVTHIAFTGNDRIRGLNAGQAVITGTAQGFSKDFNIEVKSPEALDNLEIYSGTANVTNTSVEIGLFEEMHLSAVITPANSYTWFEWSSGNDDYVSVTSAGEIKGLKTTANSSPVTIKVTASGLEREITVNVRNPVTGIRIVYDNDEKLPVSNIIWLYPGENVNLKAELAPEGIIADITWPQSNYEVSLFADGGNFTLTGGGITRFDALPAELRITARNADNGEGYVTTVVWVKTQPPPVWAWDRARDGGISNAGDPGFMTQNPLKAGWWLRARRDDDGLRLTGRGEYTEIPIKIGGNYVFYTAAGFNINSSNRNGGNPEPISLYPSGTTGAAGVMGTPSNSTRMQFGTSRGITTNPNPVPWVDGAGHQEGVFNFLETGGIIRISIDYEIVWSAGPGRNMWITVNNNQANAMQSVMGAASQLLIQPLTDPRGTRMTAVAVINTADFVARNIPGVETLETGFIGIVCLSNGGSVNISGIRIERED